MKKLQLFYLLSFLIFAMLSCKNQASDRSTISEKANNKTETKEATPVANDNKEDNKETIDLSTIRLPDGFEIEVYAKDVKNARSLRLSPKNTLFVGTMRAGKVYALQDTDGDFEIDKKYTLDQKLYMPNGVAYADGDLYVAEVNRILKYTDIENHLDNTPDPKVVYDEYPTEDHHGWKYIDFGPDGKLYVPVGAPCNVCESENPIFNTITRMNKDGSNMEIVQRGIRNTVGFSWHPSTKELWFTDNGRDWMGNDIPGCEINHAPKDNMNFGFPYCHQGDLPDPEYGKKHDCDEFTPPAQVTVAHVAPLGMEFYTGNQFPEIYKNKIFVAEHGSWNRDKKSGYRVMMATVDKNNKITSYEPFAEGWLNHDTQEVWGRPVDLEILSDGSLLVSDDHANAIYRIRYQG